MTMSPRLLRPRSTVHPEAAAWAASVVSNGGTVSGSTLSAVSKFCASIASAGIRDRFYRLNLFCGTGLNAALVPLYRTWRVYSGRNLLSVGDNLSASAWTKSGTTVTQSSSERPFAYGPYANVVTATAGSGVTPYVVAAGVVGFGTVTYSAYLKANGQNTVRILPIGTAGQTFPGGGTVAYANIDLSTGVISSVLAGTTATATNVGNGWWRLAYTVTNNGSGQTSLRFDIGNGNPYTAAGTESVLFWGLQNELGSTATEFDPYPLGNATDTNVGSPAFLDVTNYTEATGLGAASGKYLKTGLTQATVGLACHLAFYDCVRPTNSYAAKIGSRGAGNAHEHVITNVDVTTTIDYGSGSVAGNGRARATGYTQAGAFWLGINPSATSSILYKNGAAPVTGTPSARTAQGLEYYVFGLNDNGTLADSTTTGQSGGYSIGLSMDATQAAAYNAAMQAFQTSLTRNAT